MQSMWPFPPLILRAACPTALVLRVRQRRRCRERRASQRGGALRASLSGAAPERGTCRMWRLSRLAALSSSGEELPRLAWAVGVG